MLAHSRAEQLLRTAPTVLYLHGNAGNIGIRMPHFLDLHNKLKVNILVRPRCTVLLAD